MPLPISFTSDLQQVVQGAGIGNGPGQCPMQPDGTCGSLSDNCSQVRECDAYTGATHFEYATGGQGSGNANIWVVSPDNSSSPVWHGNSGSPEPPPPYAPPVPVHAPNGAYDMFNKNVVDSLNAAVSTIGLSYNPASGYTPKPNSVPPVTQPTIPVFTSASDLAAAATTVTPTPLGTATGIGPSVGGVKTQPPAIAVQTSNNWVVIIAIGALIYWAVK